MACPAVAITRTNRRLTDFKTHFTTQAPAGYQWPSVDLAAVEVEIWLTFCAGRLLGKLRSVDMERLVNVLCPVITEIVEVQLNLSGNLLMDCSRNTHPAWFGKRLNPRSQIDPVAINVAPVVYDLAKIDANPKLQTPVFGQSRIPCRHLALKLNGAANRCSGTAELCKNRVPRLIDFLVTMRANDIAE